MRARKAMLAGAMLAGAMLAGVGGGPALAAGPGKVGDAPEGVWSGDCTVDRMTDVRSCRVTIYRQVGEGAGAAVVALSVVPVDKDFDLVLSTSRGMVDECALRVDRKPHTESRIATYNVCVFPRFAASKMLDLFKSGSTILARLVFRDGRQEDIDFPLKGFAPSFDDMNRSLQ